jgi:hypothetical protein
MHLGFSVLRKQDRWNSSVALFANGEGISERDNDEENVATRCRESLIQALPRCD